MAPQTSKVVKKLVDNYLDNTAYSCEEGGLDTIVCLLEQKWDLIQFTGSPLKGRLIAQAAAKHLTRTVLELGGKSPCVIDKDCNVASTVIRLAQTKFTNSGQTCVAPDYVFIQEDVYDEIVPKLVSTVRQQFYQQDGSVNEGQVSIVNEFHTKRINDMIKGTSGKVLIGGTCDLANRKVDYTVIE